MRTLSAILLLCVFHASSARPPAPKGQGNAVKGWGFFIDPDKDCEWKIADGVLAISLPPKPHALQYPSKSERKQILNSPRVVQPVKGDFTLRLDYPKATLPKGTKAAEGESPYLAAGILVWKDERNFVRLTRSQNTGNSNIGKIQVSGYADAVLKFEWPKDVADIEELKVERTDRKLGFHYRVKDAKEWLTADKCAYEFEGEVQVGVVVVNKTAAAFTATFSGLRLEEK